MSVLTFTFKVLTICGCWPPNSWTSWYKRIIYDAYTILIVVIINIFTLSQLMDLILSVDNVDDFAENFYVMLSMFVSCCKMFSLLRNRDNISILIDTLMKKPYRPTEHDEIDIRQKFDKFIQQVFLK